MIPGSANSLLLASAAAAPTGYNIERSLRFNSSDSAYLSKVFSTPTDAKKQTYSFWVKRTGLGQIGGVQRAITNAYTGGSTATGIYFDSDSIQVTVTSGGDNVKSTAVFRDTSAWYHFVVAVDTTQATASNRVRIYANGVEITSFSVASYPALNTSTQFANSSTSIIATLYNAAGYWFDGYLAEFYYIDGQALDPTSFGEFDANGVWQPIEYTGSYGTNGFHLPFSDNSTAAALGTDTSGNGNTWTVNNISVAAGAGNDSLVDTPTNGSQTDTGVGGEVVGNYCTWNPLINGDTAANGNLDVTNDTARGTQKLLEYDAYWEITSIGGTTTAGVVSDGGTTNTTTVADGKTYGFKLSAAGALEYINITDGGSFTSITTGLTGIQFPYASAASSTTASLNAGQRPFVATAPSGYKALCTANLPSTTITTSGSYTGNGVADGPFVYLNGVPTAMTVNGNAVTFGTHADKLSNGFKIRTNSTTYNQNASTYTYSITSTGDPFKTARAQNNP